MRRVTVQGTISYTVEVEDGEDLRHAAWLAEGGLNLVCRDLYDLAEQGQWDGLEGEVAIDHEAFSGVVLVDGQAYDV